MPPTTSTMIMVEMSDRNIVREGIGVKMREITVVPR